MKKSITSIGLRKSLILGFAFTVIAVVAPSMLVRAAEPGNANAVDKQVSVSGQVRRPGTQALKAGYTVADAIRSANGFTDTAKQDSVKVTRIANGTAVRFTIDCTAVSGDKIDGKQDGTFPLAAGDIYMFRRIAGRSTFSKANQSPEPTPTWSGAADCEGWLRP
jgi:SLBB domain